MRESEEKHRGLIGSRSRVTRIRKKRKMARGGLVELADRDEAEEDKKREEEEDEKAETCTR